MSQKMAGEEIPELHSFPKQLTEGQKLLELTFVELWNLGKILQHQRKTW